MKLARPRFSFERDKTPLHYLTLSLSAILPRYSKLYYLQTLRLTALSMSPAHFHSKKLFILFCQVIGKVHIHQNEVYLVFVQLLINLSIYKFLFRRNIIIILCRGWIHCCTKSALIKLNLKLLFI
jgi:hypothetical protein